MAEDKEMTPEEIAKIKENRQAALKFWEEETPFLEKQAAYEEAVTRIEVAKMTRIEIMMAKAQFMKKPDESKEDGGDREL